MLIRNVKSKSDLDKKLEIQAKMLQIAIDNESVLESRVKDYKNPNKPPSLPPQYKTNAEVQQDTNLQQKEVISNLTSIKGIDNGLAVAVSASLAQLPDGTTNYLKFNTNFPYIRKNIEESLNPRYLDLTTLMNRIEDLFTSIDNGLQLNIAGSTATNVFNQQLGAGTDLPSGQDVAALMAAMQAGNGNAVVSLYGQLLVRLLDMRNTPNSQLAADPDFAAMFDIVGALCDNSPSEDNLQNIDIIEQIERQKVQREIDKIINTFKCPSSVRILAIVQELDPAIYDAAVQQAAQQLGNAPPVLPINFTKAYTSLINAARSIKQPATSAFNALRNLKTKLERLLQGALGVQAGLQGQVVAAQAQAQAAAAQAQAAAAAAQAQLVQDLADKQITRDKIDAFETARNPATYKVRLEALGIKQNNLPLTIGGQPIFDRFSNQLGTGWIQTGNKNYRAVVDADLPQGFTTANIQQYLDQFLLQRNIGKGSKAGQTTDRFSPLQMLAMLQGNLASVRGALNRDPAFIPEQNVNQRVVATQGFGVSPYKLMVEPEYNRVLGGQAKKPDAIHIDINSHNGENYKMSGDGFMHRKIKIGKGIEVQEQPRYKTFGKYIVHIPHLENDSVLNFKFPSMGSIPTLKPVSVDDNYKEFILDILSNGRVNQRHYDALTDSEKSHFNKVVKGAGLSAALQFKSDSKIDDKKDLKRLDILLGEVGAGNDNDKVKKEAKELIKKCVATGALSKLKAVDMLMDLD